MANILGAAVVKTAGSIFTDLITSKLANRNKASTPAAAIPPAVVVAAVKEAVGGSDEIAIVKTKPMVKSVEGWAAVSGAAVVAINQLAPLLGITINQPLSEAVETLTSLVLPAGSGRFIVAAVTIGAFAFIWVRRKFFTHTITPAAADRAYDKGKVV